MDTSHKITTTSSRLESQTVTFRDGPTEWSTSMSEGFDDSRLKTVHNDVLLDNFFERPIQIYNYIWAPGTAQALIPYFDPWTLFMSNPRVANRLTNYKNFYGKLHLKFLINGNSFYYGRMMPFYVPLSGDDSAFSPQDVRQKTLASQRLKMFIDPCESTGGEMELPFIWYRDMLDITQTGNISSLGTVGLLEMNPLFHANGATTPIDITVFAWMTDVQLSAPTVANITTITPQAGGKLARKDEYGTGPVSSLASAVASGTGSLAKVPYIGKYMRATSMVSGTLGEIANMFGFAKPTLVADHEQMRINPISALAVTSGGDASAKLTVDPKQEVSIDPSIVGLDGLDELSLNSIACRETFWYRAPWALAASPGDLICSTVVNPCITLSDVVGTFSRATIPACAFAAYPFDFWRGTMRYRFQIVASAYHKGRLKFVWEPVGGSANPESNVTYTKIVDLADERDFVIDVSWGQDACWLKNTQSTSYFSLVSRLPSNPLTSNGTLNVYVLNSLASPNSAIANDISINVYVSMCGDAEFAVPNEKISQFGLIPALPTVITPQGGDVEKMELVEDSPTAGESTEEFVPCLDVTDASSSIYFGEKISSFRQMIKRYNLLTSWGKNTATTTRITWTMPDFPMSRGYSTRGMYGTGFGTYNYSNTTMLNYMSYAFLLYRGGVRYKYINAPVTTGTCSNMYTTRSPLGQAILAPVNEAVIDTISNLSMSVQALTSNPTGLAGSHVVPARQLPSLEVEYPYYTNNRFSAARTDLSTTKYDADRHGLSHYLAAQLDGLSVFDVHVAAAEDMTFHLFQGCRPFYGIATVP